MTQPGAGEMVSISRPDGSTFPAYLVRAETPGPAVVVLHAYWGLTKHYVELSDRFAREGFSALAPSLYDDGETSDDPDIADKLMDALDEDRAELDLGLSLDRLLDEVHPPEGGVATIGFSLGGWATTRLAAARPEIAAVVPFYGYSQGADYVGMRAAVQGHFAGADDDEIDPAAFERLMRDAGREVEVHRYEARHGFFNPDHPEDHDAEAAALSWERTLSFIRKHTAGRQ
jgi:carboxymethylenebutenolidase